MKLFNKILTVSIVFVISGIAAFSQFVPIQYFTPNNQDAITAFENLKNNNVKYQGQGVRIGGAFALQLQALDHSNDADNLIKLGKDFNLPTANMSIDAQLADGIRLNLDLYLASNHHHETWVKGGYMQIDNLNFISEGLLSGLMENVTIKVGQMENNYGDAHFRRSDNGSALKNPFIGNLILDGFMTEVGAEVYYTNSGVIVMAGFSNSKLNQDVTHPNQTTPAIIAKAGWDGNIAEDFRLRLTGSIYHTAQTARVYIYSGDRTGSRFYNVIQTEDDESADFRAGRYAPKFAKKITAIMFNNLLTYKGFELFSTFETSKDDNLAWTQFASELIYRFGSKQQFYAGGKFNMASGDDASAVDKTVSINRMEAGAGWFLTKNILTKLIYINQDYKDFASTSKFAGANFKGFTIEAVISL